MIKKFRIIEEAGKAWAIARAIENELEALEPKDDESLDHLDSVQSLAYLLTDILAVLRKTAYDA